MSKILSSRKFNFSRNILFLSFQTLRFAQSDRYERIIQFNIGKSSEDISFDPAVLLA